MDEPPVHLSTIDVKLEPEILISTKLLELVQPKSWAGEDAYEWEVGRYAALCMFARFFSEASQCRLHNDLLVRIGRPDNPTYVYNSVTIEDIFLSFARNYDHCDFSLRLLIDREAVNRVDCLGAMVQRTICTNEPISKLMEVSSRRGFPLVPFNSADLVGSDGKIVHPGLVFLGNKQFKIFLHVDEQQSDRNFMANRRSMGYQDAPTIGASDQQDKWQHMDIPFQTALLTWLLSRPTTDEHGFTTNVVFEDLVCWNSSTPVGVHIMVRNAKRSTNAKHWTGLLTDAMIWGFCIRCENNWPDNSTLTLQIPTPLYTDIGLLGKASVVEDEPDANQSVIVSAEEVPAELTPIRGHLALHCSRKNNAEVKSASWRRCRLHPVPKMYFVDRDKRIGISVHKPSHSNRCMSRLELSRLRRDL